MRILIAEDDATSRKTLATFLGRWGYDVCETCNGTEACDALRRSDAPSLAILDWMMPELNAVEVCRLVRTLEREEPTYLILLTARSDKEDMVAGLCGGADDNIVKPFDRDELGARLQVRQRIVELQRRLAQRVRELEEAFSNIRLLRGLLPICRCCKRIRDDGNYWQSVEAYISQHSDARFSHGICPEECYEGVIKPQLAPKCNQNPEWPSPCQPQRFLPVPGPSWMAPV
jgi:CheY-like chemotaxis protein